MKYYVTFALDARYIAEVEADNLEDAMKKADEEYMNADFGAAQDIDGKKVTVEDEDGNYVWEQ